MRTHLTTPRGTLALLFVGSAILFLVGSTIERNHRHHNETSAAKPAKVTGRKTGSETGAEGSKQATAHAESGHGEAGVKLLGVNTESLALSIIAVVLSLLLAAVVLARAWARIALLAVAVFGLVFAAGDARELVHQLNDSNGGLAAVAALLIGLHLAVAGLAAAMLARRLRGESPPLPAPVG